MIKGFKFHRRFFFRYFGDACRYVGMFVDDAPAQKSNRAHEKMYVRSTVLHCALALEAAANACLDGLSLQKATHEDFDKLRTLAKFDVFLSRLLPGKHIDREHKLVRPIRNLIACRDTYVHSKVLKEDFEIGGTAPKSWDPLGLPKNQNYWLPVHAVKVLTVTCDFLNHFFFDLCPFDYGNPNHRGQVAGLLGSVIHREDGELGSGQKTAHLDDDDVWAPGDFERKFDIQCGFTGMYSTVANKIVLPKRIPGDYSHCNTSGVVVPTQLTTYRLANGAIGILPAVELVKRKKQETASNAPPPDRPAVDIPAPGDNAGEPS